MSTEEDVAKALAMVPGLISAGKSIFDAIESASQGDAEAAHQHTMEANAKVALELAKRELK